MRRTRETRAAFGRGPPFGEDRAGHDKYWSIVYATPAWQHAQKLYSWLEKFGSWVTYAKVGRDGLRIDRDEFWRATVKDRRLLFHRPDVPVNVWAVSIQPAGVIWAEAEVSRITELNVIVRYAGETARLDRERLWKSWALWRGVIFVSSRTGRSAQRLDAMWQDRYGRAAGGVPPVMQMPLAEAMALPKVPADYSKEDVLAAFRREAKKAHPDAGGTAERFRQLVEARDRLLAALGTSAPAPKPPTYAPSGSHIVYRRVRIGAQGRLGHARRLT
jgi:rRNA maturation protein Nop10